MSAKLSVLFVDDDENLLRGFRRNLREHRREWDVTFINNPLEAVDLLGERGFDVVVSDMRMPEMDGASLMKEVEARYPECLRVILSGYAEEESIMRTIAPTHQYFAKPCTADEIVELLERTYALHLELQDPELRKVVAGLENLPTPSDLYFRLTEEMNKENCSLRSISGMISEDVAMTAEILRITNSGYFSLGQPVHDVFQAVRLLGLETIHSLVFAVGIFREMRSQEEISDFLDDLDAHSLMVATQARIVAQKLELRDDLKDQAFCAGMLSCVGTLILMDAYPDKMRGLFSRVLLGEDYLTTERDTFGASQAEIGAYLLGIWGFSEAVVEAVLYHDRPSECVYKEHSALTCVHVARALGAELVINGTALHPITLDDEYVDVVGVREILPEITLH